MTENEAIKYLNGLTRYVNEKDALINIAYEVITDKDGNELGKILDFEFGEVPTQVKDLCKVKLYDLVISGPWSVASSSLQHGNFRQDVGSETVTAAVIERLIAERNRLLKKYGFEEEAEETTSGGLSWVDENSLDV